MQTMITVTRRPTGVAISGRIALPAVATVWPMAFTPLTTSCAAAFALAAAVFAMDATFKPVCFTAFRAFCPADACFIRSACEI